MSIPTCDMQGIVCLLCFHTTRQSLRRTIQVSSVDVVHSSLNLSKINIFVILEKLLKILPLYEIYMYGDFFFKVHTILPN